MRCYFSIDALAASGDASWRLQQDEQTWRCCTFAEALQADDCRMTEQSDAAAWHGRRLKREKDQLQAQEKAGRFDFLTRGIFAHAILHRCSVVPIPDLLQMREVVKRHEAGTPWLLYLNIAGQFVMLDTLTTSIMGNLNIAVRGEIASSPAYVGEEAACDDVLMTKIYHQFLAGWWQHLHTSRMGMFVPEASALRPLEEYTAHIDGWQAESL